jgi:hypothetical protein
MKPRLTECAVKESNLQPTIWNGVQAESNSVVSSCAPTLNEYFFDRIASEPPNTTDNRTTIGASGVLVSQYPPQRISR